MCGISGAAVVSMGTIALPSMLKRNYDKLLAVGCINSGGGWGILIPPSVIMILYALISGESVGKLFAGGVFPGLLLLVMVSGYIAIRCYFQPHLGPALPREERGDWGRKFKAFKAVLLPMIIVLMVLGSIIGGITTPTEAAAMGVLGALISALVYRQLSWRLIEEAALRTLRLTGMIMWILFGAGGSPSDRGSNDIHTGWPLGDHYFYTDRHIYPGHGAGSGGYHDDYRSHIFTCCQGPWI
jgi:tripartite ATP-independent transporter DctM subunit